MLPSQTEELVLKTHPAFDKTVMAQRICATFSILTATNFVEFTGPATSYYCRNIAPSVKVPASRKSTSYCSLIALVRI